MQVVIEDSQPVDGPPSDVGAARPSWLQLVAAVVALGFLAGAGVYWWQQPEAEPGRVDIGFYDDMSTHHLQGIQMGFTYLEGGSDPVLLHMAREIVLWQSGELRLMQQALQDWGEEGTPEQAMEWMGMSPVPQDAQPGMATPQETVSLERATGRELDDLLSRLMIDHHAGGIHMAEAAAEHASIDDVRELADAMARTQRAEINELNQRRQTLGLEAHEPHQT